MKKIALFTLFAVVLSCFFCILLVGCNSKDGGGSEDIDDTDPYDLSGRYVMVDQELSEYIEFREDGKVDFPLVGIMGGDFKVGDIKKDGKVVFGLTVQDDKNKIEMIYRAKGTSIFLDEKEFKKDESYVPITSVSVDESYDPYGINGRYDMVDEVLNDYVLFIGDNIDFSLLGIFGGTFKFQDIDKNGTLVPGIILYHQDEGQVEMTYEKKGDIIIIDGAEFKKRS